jgi:DNA transposition AAA+ family ATPase
MSNTHTQTPRLPTVPALPTREEVETSLADKATPEQIGEITWLLDEARRRGLTTYAAIGKLVGRDSTTISRIMTGSYSANLDPFCTHIRGFRDHQTVTAPDDEPWVKELSVVSAIVPFCDMARFTQQVAIIWGENQSGKTKALEHYAATKLDTVYVRIPAGGGLKKTIEELSKACGISARKDDDELRDRILKRFTPSTLLIVDEFHQAVNGRTIKTVTVERIREIHDLCGCGIVLCGTHVVCDMIEDRRFKRFLGQIDNRGRLRLNIPKAPTKKDREMLIRVYGLDLPDADTAKAVKAICDNNGIAALTDYFKIARQLAKKRKETFGWHHFNETLTTLKAWASGIQAEEENAK